MKFNLNHHVTGFMNGMKCVKKYGMKNLLNEWL